MGLEAMSGLSAPCGPRKESVKANNDLPSYQLKLQEIDWHEIDCLNCGASVYLTRDGTWFHRKNSLSSCGEDCDLAAAPDLDRAVKDIDREDHQSGCICTDCSGAEFDGRQ